MAVKYKQKCIRCKKNYVVVTYIQKFPICYDCHKLEMSGKITNKKMKKFFDIPEKYYKENIFLRNIKLNYLRYHNLTEKQINAFKKVVKLLKEKKKKTR